MTNAIVLFATAGFRSTSITRPNQCRMTTTEVFLSLLIQIFQVATCIANQVPDVIKLWNDIKMGPNNRCEFTG